MPAVICGKTAVSYVQSYAARCPHLLNTTHQSQITGLPDELPRPFRGPLIRRAANYRSTITNSICGGGARDCPTGGACRVPFVSPQLALAAPTQPHSRRIRNERPAWPDSTRLGSPRLVPPPADRARRPLKSSMSCHGPICRKSETFIYGGLWRNPAARGVLELSGGARSAGGPERGVNFPGH